MSWQWPKRDEKGLVRCISRDAVNWLRLPVNRLDLIQQPNGVRLLVASIYEALVQKQIRYSQEAFDPDDETQLIRNAPEILESPGEGTCLDLATLFCGLCLGFDLLPTIIVIEGHALAAVSLKHQRPQWDDMARERAPFREDLLRSNSKLLEFVDSGAYLAIECTGFAHSTVLPETSIEGAGRTEGYLSFEQAILAGRRQLENVARPFHFACDVAFAQDKWHFSPYSMLDQSGTYSAIVQKGLGDLEEAVASPSSGVAREAVIRFQDGFETASQHIETMAGYKDIHDQLHNLQFHCYYLVVDIINQLQQGDTPAKALRDLTVARGNLEGILQSLQDFMKKPSFPLQDMTWLGELQRTSLFLREANRSAREGRNTEEILDHLEDAKFEMRGTLMQQPVHYDALLKEAVVTLGLPALHDAMIHVHASLCSPEISQEVIDSFEAGANALPILKSVLDELVACHNRWQDLDFNLRSTEALLTSDMNQLRRAWSKLSSLIEPLVKAKDEDWAEDIQIEVTALQQAVNTREQDDFVCHFLEFRNLVGYRFFTVDKDLLALCNRMREIGRPLSSLLKAVQ